MTQFLVEHVTSGIFQVFRRGERVQGWVNELKFEIFIIYNGRFMEKDVSSIRIGLE